MKFKNVLIFFSLSFCYIPLHAHNFCEEAFYNFPNSISQITGSQETKHPTAKESFKRNFSYMGIPFITAGLIVKNAILISGRSATGLSQLFIIDMTTIHNMFLWLLLGE